MTATAAAIIWAVGIIIWIAIRFPHQKRARRLKVARHQRSNGERAALLAAGIGLVVVPVVHLTTKVLRFADYSFFPLAGWIGMVILLVFLWLFRESHRQLGKNWSITLEIREEHKLVTGGIYRYIRHPMYSAFWLWAIAQAFLLPNWIAGFSGLVGVAILYFSRVAKEEAMMRESFGAEYEAFCATTGRIVPKMGQPK